MTLDIRLERDELHERLGGGLPHGSLILIEGAPGTGKSILAERLLYGALENGATAAIVTSELTTPAFLEQMRSLGYPVVEPVLRGRLHVVPVVPLYSRGVDASRRVARLTEASALWKRDLVVVDTLSSLLQRDVRDAGGDATSVCQAAATALGRRAAAGCTVLVTVDPDEVPPEALGPLRAAATAYLEVALTTRGGVARSVLLRRYARAPDAAGDRFSFRVEPREGLVVEIRSVN